MFCKNKMKVLTALVCMLNISVACSLEKENSVEKCAIGFAQSYFNLRFDQAAQSCSKESRKWIKFHASNITQEDIEVLNSQSDTAICKVEDIDTNGDTAIVTLSVNNFLRTDSLGSKGYICHKAQFKLQMIKMAEKWIVKLNHPLQTFERKQ